MSEARTLRHKAESEAQLICAMPGISPTCRPRPPYKRLKNHDTGEALEDGKGNASEQDGIRSIAVKRLILDYASIIQLRGDADAGKFDDDILEVQDENNLVPELTDQTDLCQILCQPPHANAGNAGGYA
ncbi:hypothetical protein CDV36_012190 [Fusarium kuroshium]|uniref:Uncharacterized protein n=3 Tax=Fusarium solani species complex TaxID=232080 RepID=A0A3M2RSE1_9HYPO|nr:hypothetical protein CDV36_012190 [Fusarium kuroshium]RSL87526.1 hypothetical protein CEP51_002218 [Fusarium floridanum]RSM11866.1 hypothetical protein CEP52_002747 [Fusarium oligoseptatum]